MYLEPTRPGPTPHLQAQREEQRKLHAQYPEKVLGALSKMQLASILGLDSATHELGFTPWGHRVVNPYFFEPGELQSHGIGLRLTPVEEAEQDLSEAVSWWPDRADAYWHRARCRVLLGDEDLALEDLDRTLELRADFLPAVFLKASLLDGIGREEVARDLRSEADRLPTDSFVALWLEAQRAARGGRRDEAIHSFKAALAGRSTLRQPCLGWDVEILSALARLQIEADRAHEALISISIVRYVWPESVLAKVQEARARFLLNEHIEDRVAGTRESEEILTRLHKTSRFRDEVAFMAVRAYLDGRLDPDLALEWAARIEQQPILRFAAEMEALFMSGRFPEAEQLGREAIAAHPEVVGFYRCLGNVFANQGRWSEAEVVFRSALVRAPNSLTLRVCLAGALASRGKKEEALRHCAEIERHLDRVV